jgi:hypothetical protein
VNTMLKVLAIAVVGVLLAAAPVAAAPNPGQGHGPIAFPGFKFGPVILQGSGTQDVDEAGRVVNASGSGTVTNFPYLCDSAYSYDVAVPPPESCSAAQCKTFLLGTFTVTSLQGGLQFQFIACHLTLHGGDCQLNPGGFAGEVVGTGAAAGVDGWGTAHLSWIPLRGGHSESGFIIPALTKITEAK